MNSSKVSIVIPIYNVEEYLTRCLESIIAQTYSNIDVLLIDDGSPDGCGAICDDYAARDSRFVVHHVPNGGVAKARQMGVELSSGDYITFVDPDDWMEHNAVEVLLSHMRDDLDLVICRSRRILAHKIKNRRPLPEVEWSRDEYIRHIASYSGSVAPWGKLYRRHLFTADSFPRFKHTQDWLMNLDVAFRVRRAKFTNDNIYNYFLRKSSTSQRFKHDFDYEIKFTQTTKSIIERNGEFESYKQEWAIGSLRHMRRMLKESASLDRSNPTIKEVSEVLTTMSTLSPKERLFAWALKCRLAHAYIHTKHVIKSKITNF